MDSTKTNNYVFAIYDVRGKQNFIFKTNRLKEIVGASWLIRDIFEDYLFPIAAEIGGKGIYSYKKDPSKEEFSPEGFARHLAEGYIGEVIYDGGGNFLLMFKDADTFREVTYRFTKRLLREIGSLRLQATCIDNVNFDNYQEDRKRLYAKHGLNEKGESMLEPWACVPIVQVDRKISQPYVDYKNGDWSDWNKLDRKIQESIKAAADGKDHKLTKERYAKLKKYYLTKNEKKDEFWEKYFDTNTDIFDEMVLKKGEDSQLAVVYIDGNNMSAQIQEKTKNISDYTECVKVLRQFSGEIQKTYVEGGIEAAFDEDSMADKEHRLVVYAGDEINFVVRAKDAFGCAKRYIDSLSTVKDASACAGIAVFHSHSPYSDAYRIAEECCESGKKLMKKKNLTNACFIDFHLIQGAVGSSLEDIRKHERTLDTSRPWRMDKNGSNNADDYTNFEDITFLQNIFNKLGRSNVKGMAEVAKRSKNDLMMELYRIRAHIDNNNPDNEGLSDTIEKEIIKKLKNNSPRMREKIYDIIIAYDLWFCDENTEAKGV